MPEMPLLVAIVADASEGCVAEHRKEIRIEIAYLGQAISTPDQFGKHVLHRILGIRVRAASAEHHPRRSQQRRGLPIVKLRVTLWLATRQ